MSLAGAALSPKYLPLWVFVPPALYYHFRGRVRFRFHRQLFDHSTFMAPYNALVTLFSAVPRTPFVDPALVPELRLLRESWEVLRDEALALHRAGRIRGRDETFDDAGFNSFFRRGWKRFYLKWYGEPHASARELCPRSLAILERTPHVRAAAFVRMGPRNRLPTHRDPFAGSLRYHLGLRTPNSEACRMIVDGTTYWWRDGEDVLFDETYVHQVFNDTDEDRLILFCDVERPLRSRLLARVNDVVCRRVMRMARSANVDGEPVGAINRLFAAIYPVRVFTKKLKRANAHLYYVVKYALTASMLGSLLYLI